jgi:hypothetical protein
VHHLHPRDILLHPRDLELILLLIRKEAVDGVLQPTHEVMACLAASTTASLRDAVKVRPWCPKRTLDLRKISVMVLNSTHLGRRTSLILYLGAVVMPKCTSRA